MRWPFRRRLESAHWIGWGFVALGAAFLIGIAQELEGLNGTHAGFRWWWWPTNWMAIPAAILVSASADTKSLVAVRPNPHSTLRSAAHQDLGGQTRISEPDRQDLGDLTLAVPVEFAGVAGGCGRRETLPAYYAARSPELAVPPIRDRQ